MTSSSVDGVTVYPISNMNNQRLVFDRNVGGSSVAAAGAAAWYLMNIPPDNDVAYSGIIQKFRDDGSFHAPASLAWIAVSFPARKLIGYLYSIDNSHSDNPYAASIYFESRAIAGSDADSDSIVGGWNQIRFISFDKCIGKCWGITPNLANEQATLDSYALSVWGLTGAEKDKAFIIDDNGGIRNIIQYNHAAGEWQDKGQQYTDVISSAENRTHYEDFTKNQVTNISPRATGGYCLAALYQRF